MKGAAVLLACSLAMAGGLGATTYQVGPTRQYATLQDVAGLLQPGDLVEVDGNQTYPGDVVFTESGTAAQPITVRGIRIGGQRPVLSGGTNTVAFSTPWPYEPPGADWYIFEGFEVTGGSSRCVYHQAGDLVIRDTLVRDCPAHGILGADQGSGSLTLERVEVYGCGDGSYRHQIYLSTDQVNRPGSLFTMRFCYLHDGNGGNNVKTRAERNEIFYNWIEGAYYHELELIGPDPGGVADGWTPELAREDSDVVGNVLWKKGDNASFYVTRVGGDGTGDTDGRYRFVNNTIITSAPAVFRVFDGIESIEMHNNVFFCPGSGAPAIMHTSNADWSSGSEVISGENNWVESGATEVPSQWTGTVTGADPGFTDLAAGDLSPLASSPLLDSGADSPGSPVGYPFPDPLMPPIWQPAAAGSGLPQPRATGDSIDIGAYERCLFADGFEWGDTSFWSARAP